MNYPDEFINKIVLGDCLEVMQDIPDSSIDLVVTSPPYDNQRTYGGNRVDLNLLGVELFRILKPNSVCVMVIQDQTKNFSKSLTSFRTIITWCDILGFKLFECCIYKRSGVPGAWWNKRFRVDHEYIPIFLKGEKPKYFNKEHMKISANQAGAIKMGKERKNNDSFTEYLFNPKRYPLKKCPGTILDYESARASDKSLKLDHPAWFPEKLALDFILCFSDIGEIILDPLIGSGTVATASLKTNRRFIGIEKNKNYVDIAVKRLEEMV